jgi:PAS domain S-box-containing protein
MTDPMNNAAAKPRRTLALSPWRNWSLKTKFALCGGALMFLFSLTFTFSMLRSTEADLRSAVIDSQRTLVRSTVKDIDDKIDLRIDAVKTIAPLLALSHLAPGPDMDAFFKPRPVLQKMFDVVLVTDASGRVVHDLPHQSAGAIIGDTVAGSDFFKRLAGGETMVVSAARRSLASGEAVVMFAAPLRAPDGAFNGALLCVLKLTRPNFLGDAAKSRIGREGFFALFERGANPVLLMHIQQELIMTPLPADTVRGNMAPALVGAEGASEGPSLRGETALRTFAPLRAVPWQLVAVYPTAEAYAGLQARKYEVLKAGGGLFLIASVLTWLLSGWLLRPLERLRAQLERGGVERVAALDPQSYGSAELSTLVTAYNTQAARRDEFEQRLRASEQRMRSITDNIPALIVQVDTQQRYTFSNDHAGISRTLVQDRGAILGRTLREVLGEAGYAAIAPRVDETLRGETVMFERTFLVGSDRFHYQTSYIPDRDDAGSVRGFYAMIFDITELREAQLRQARIEDVLRSASDEVKRSEMLLRGAIDALEGAFALFDADDRLVLWNQPYFDMYPLCADQIVQGASFEQIVRAGLARGQHPEALGRADEWLAERMEIHRRPGSELTQQLGDGRTLRVVERRLPDGHTVCYRGDITELVRATEAAQAASQSKGQFLANMSHEIRTPMNAILGMLSLLRKTEFTPRQDDYAGKAEGAARSMLHLLNDILDFSKVEAGKMTLDPQPFRVDRLLRDLGVILTANIGAKPVTLRFDVDAALPAVLVGDAPRLLQVLINLGGNAVKFTAAGEVALSLTVLESQGDAVVLEIGVRDSGIGIAPENQARIFSGFTQAEASTTRHFGGTGLGLVISQRLVALMGGELALTSALGEGSRFYFRLGLPVASVAEAAALDVPPTGPAGAAGGPRLSGMRILLAEDNLNNQQVARELLELEGAQVVIAGDGQQALDALARTRPAFDVVLMDVQMPVLDGIGATRRIRAELGLTQLPIIAMTANAMDAERQLCLDAGMIGHVGKPFDLDHLVRVLLQHAGRAVAELEVLPAAGVVPMPGAAIVPDPVQQAAAAAGVDIAPALARFGGNRAIYTRMLDRFVTELGGMRDGLLAHQTQHQWRAASHIAHTLKGLAATLGAGALAAHAARSEKLLADAPASAVMDEAVTALRTAIHDATPTLAALRATLLAEQARDMAAVPEETPAAFGHLAFVAAIDVLAAQLRAGDMAATASMETLLARCQATPGLGLEPLAQAIAALDFEQALLLCGQLTEGQPS